MHYLSFPKSQKDYTVVVADGSFPSHQTPLMFLENTNNIIACDGAANTLISKNIIPQVIIGDCDSLDKTIKNKFENIIQKIDEQETNDLTKAINYCASKHIEKVVIIGATGKREDHTLANLSLLEQYQSKIKDISILSDYGYFNFIFSDTKLESFIGQQVSLFCVEESIISSKNLVYKIEKRKFSRLWEATLNESKSGTFEIFTTKPVLVFRGYK